MALTDIHLYPLEEGWTRVVGEREGERPMSDKVKERATPKVADAMKILRQYMPKR